MPYIGHYSGRLGEGVKKANEATRGREGSFYGILNDAGFYDIDDENNGLADWQRAGVPEYNRRRMSKLGNAISDMIADFLSNPEYGVLTPMLDEIVNKLDARGSMNKGSLDVVTTAISAIPGGQAVKGASMAMEQLVSVAMGGNPFDPDLLPPIALNFPGLPSGIGNCYKPGFFTADWEFLYDHEPVKNRKFYAGPDGSTYIGAGIPLAFGGNSKALLLKMVFSVPTVNDNGNPEGDSVNGVSANDFKKILKAADMSFTDVSADSELASFSLTDGQMRAAYYKYVQITLWNAIKNSGNWCYLHWGCIANNACPTPVKTATCSFIKTNGMALEPTGAGVSACLYSYLINTGVAYLTGRGKPTGLLAIPGVKYIDADNHVVKVTSEMISSMETRWLTDNNGIPKDADLANRHFMLAADVLARMTYDSHPDADNLRKRRLDEANLIYSHCAGQTIQFGSATIPPELSRQGMKSRGFLDLVNQTFMVYPNAGIKLPEDPNAVKIVDSTNSDTPVSDITKDTIRYIASQAGIPGVVITSLYRSPEKQAKTMLDNRLKANGNRPVSYAAPGRSVDDKYDEVSRKYYGTVTKLTDAKAISEARDAMTAQVKKMASNGTPVSKHGADPNVIQAVDMGPNSMKQMFKLTDAQLKRFHVACYDAWKNKYIRAYFGPPGYGDKAKDPAFHIEVFQDPQPPYRRVPSSSNENLTVMPSVACTISPDTQANLCNFATLDAVFARDQIIAAG